MLRLSLEPRTSNHGELALGKGLRLIWIKDALDPLRARLTEREFDRLVQAISAAIGIEALVTLTDLVGLSSEDAIEVMRWSAQALLRAAVADAETRRS